MGREALVLLVRRLKSWGISSKELWGILLEHPLLLLNHPGEIFHYKAKMFRKFDFTSKMAQAILRKHPAALIWYSIFHIVPSEPSKQSYLLRETGSRSS